MRLLITGGAGVLGSLLSRVFIDMGHKVQVVDISRKEEAWRLFDVFPQVDYVWKSVMDISRSDLQEFDMVLDCAIGFADRPFGTESPQTTTVSNILPSLNLLEKSRKLEKRPIIVYPSSFNALYGHLNDVIDENSLPLPTSVYGWTKASVELLYLTYHFSYGVPVVITRTSSSFGPKGRSDELPHRLMLSMVNDSSTFYLRSPYAKRLWTFSEDVSSFYRSLIENTDSLGDQLHGKILHLGGNKEDRILTNVELSKLISDVAGKDIQINMGEYEPGEVVNGRPVTFEQDANATRKLLGWSPSWSLEEGLRITYEWFRDHRDRYEYKNESSVVHYSES